MATGYSSNIAWTSKSQSSDCEQVVPERTAKPPPLKKKKCVANVDECVQTICESVETVFKYTTNENFRQKTFNILKVDSPSLVGDAFRFRFDQLAKSIYTNRVDARTELSSSINSTAEIENLQLVPDVTPSASDEYFDQLALDISELY